MARRYDFQATKSIPPFKLVPQPLNEKAASLPPFKHALPPIGSRHQLGGEPEFIQDDDIPVCACNKRKMTFYAQLDSINDEYCLGDCGMIYVFVCFDCLETKAVLQMY